MSKSHLPDRIIGSVFPATSRRVEAAANRAEQAVIEHALEAWALGEIDRADTMALFGALEIAADAEMRFYDEFSARAGTSAVKQELLARKLDYFSRANNRRAASRWGA